MAMMLEPRWREIPTQVDPILSSLAGENDQHESESESLLTRAREKGSCPG